MRHALKLHPDSRCAAVAQIEVEISRPGARILELRYVVTGDVAALRIPPLAAPARTDGLWQHTCFELFVREAAGPRYCEFNFAPSTQWAAYRFDGYREGMAQLDLPAPSISAQAAVTRFEMRVSMDVPFPHDPASRLALSAVIEEADGCKSWWATAHPDGKPDFHHPDNFLLALPPLSPAAEQT